MPNSPSRRPEDTLIDTIVDHVRRGDAKREEALEHYRQAGDGLLQLKLWVGRGKFEPLKEQMSSRLDISRARIGHLMKLANEWPVDWDRWQEICGNKRPPAKPAPVKTPTPDPDDLDHALKLATMRDRGGTENERRVAAEKLSRFASTFDMTPDVLETKAKASTETTHTPKETTNDQRNPDLRPDFDDVYRVWLQRVRRHAADLSRDELCDLLAGLHATLEVQGLDPFGGRPSWERE